MFKEAGGGVERRGFSAKTKDKKKKVYTFMSDKCIHAHPNIGY